MDEVMLTREGISIRGEKRILLCASLFYFRIPRDEWEDRIRKLKASGYNCADVYFPWNYHETAPGQWDFGGDRDAEEFLRLLESNGLFVIARPGPYICSEWDGGGIPAWVLTDRTLRIRQNDPDYLGHVRRWYEKILPVIAAHQADKGGSVILMQLENELDFYDCDDSRGYMDALRGMAREMGITVPVFGCAGQSDANAATGKADGVEVTFNFYGNPCDPDYGEKFHYYYERMKEAGRPLLISETNCDHLFLRRELAAGAKLLGAYCQVGGTNFGFTGGVNNWGKRGSPASFIPTKYTNANMIGPAGELQEQYYEGRRLAGLIHTFGAVLGGAESAACESGLIRCGFPTGARIFRLDLTCGGSLVCVPNLGDREGTASVSCSGVSFKTEIAAHTAPFFPFHIPLSLFGRHEGTLVRADGELESCGEENGTLVFTFWTESDAPFAEFSVNGKSEILTRERSSYPGIRVVLAGEKVLRRLPLSGVELPPVSQRPAGVRTAAAGRVRFSRKCLSDLHRRLEALRPLEKTGVFRGAGSYRFQVEGEGVLLLGGSDIVAVYRNGKFEGACVPVGGTKYQGGNGEYEILTAIWGHSNFADSRLPALMLDSERGLTKAVDVRSVLRMEGSWLFSRAEGDPPAALHIPRRTIETMIPIGSWNTTRAPFHAVYRKNIRPDQDCDSLLLELRGFEAEAVLYVDGERAGRVNPRDPFVDISRFIRGKTDAELALFLMERSWDEPAGTPLLYSGQEIKTCAFAALTEDLLIQAAGGECECAAELPLSLSAGDILNVSIPGESAGSGYLRVRGRNIFAVAFSGGRILGRVLLWEDFTGMAGNAECLYLPESFRGPELRLLILALGENAQLSEVTTEPAGDIE